MANDNEEGANIDEDEVKEVDEKGPKEAETGVTEYSINLELGDIIEIIAPSNPTINEITAIIIYVDAKTIKLINVATTTFHQLHITEEGRFTDESITQIHLLGRSEDKGYARQQNLLPGKWVDIQFGGEYPTIISGEITNLEEDMIEVTTYPGLRAIYINFGYKGIPEDIPLLSILIREKPLSIRKFGSLSAIKQQIEKGEELVPQEESPATTEFLESGESIITIPEGAIPDENIIEKLRETYVEANTIVFGKKLEAIAQLVEVPENQRRYGIDEQTNNMMDEFLSTVPNSQRTKGVMDNIHMLIERFKQLRSEFSKFDKNQNVYEEKTVGAFYKPLVERIKRLDTDLKWIVPVVANRRKIYDMDVDINIPDVTPMRIVDEIAEIQTSQEEYYKNNSKDPNLTYVNMNKRYNDILTPFEEPDNNKVDILTAQSVLTNLDSIIDNLGDFKSSVMSKSEVIKRKFVIQRYNLGSSYMAQQVMKSGKTIYMRSAMTPADKISIKSLIMLPEPIVKFSCINLPSTSILDRAHLHHNYFSLFRALRKNTEILPQIIEDISTELDYDEGNDGGNKTEFLKRIQEFVLSPEADVNDDDKFGALLETIIPKTRFLVRAIRKNVTDRFSFLGFVSKLEPFMVYPKDVTYKQYMEIRYAIKEKITELNKSVNEKSALYSGIRNAKYNIATKPNAVLRALTEEKKFSEVFFQSYGLNKKTDQGQGMGQGQGYGNEGKKALDLTSQEILEKILAIDNGNLYTNLLTTAMISLMTPDSLTNALAQPDLDDINAMEKIKPTDCNRRFLTKRYSSLSELQKDNHKEDVFYDKDFDDTPYEIMNKYKDEQKKLLNELFVEFLEESLVHKHDCPKAMVKELAATLIAGKKAVKDGEYAILEIKPKLPAGVDESTLSAAEKESVQSESDARKKIQYYKRIKNTWVYDKDIGEESFLDNNTLFCNITEKCFKNQRNKVCEDEDTVEGRMKRLARKNLEGEFDKRYAVSVEELQGELAKNIEYYVKQLGRLYFQKEIQTYKTNNLAYEMGNMASTVTIINSPYLKLRDLIIGQDDFAKKQGDICLFADRFTREPMISELEESPHWLYCKETNTKLLPRFLLDLAKVFVTGGNYSQKLAEVCRTNGRISEDGDSVVDRHSGMIIQKLEYSSEEGFDTAGFHITTNDIMEKDLGTVVLEAIGKKEKPILESEQSNMIYNVFATICSNIDIPLDTISEFVVRVSNEVIEKAVVSDTSYAKRSAANEKKTGKPLQPYKSYKNETMVTIIGSVILVAIQTAIPSFKTRKTLAGCVRSFSGYPLDGGVEDMTGMKYIACALDKSKSSTSPWDSIARLKTDTLVQRMKVITDEYIVKRDDINDLYIKKREYVLLNPEAVSVAEHSIEKWVHFLPPIVGVEVSKKLHNVTSDFINEYKELIRKGSATQIDFINTIKSKMALYGYSLIETVNAVVKEKNLLLKTSSLVPFLENACCSESILTNPIIYFNQENANIRICIKATRQLSKTMSYTRELSRAAFLYNPEFTGIRYPSIPAGHLLENMYAAIIFYCNFDRPVPIPEAFKVICSEKPSPDSYNIYWPLADKIAFLKQNGKNYDIEHLRQLMTLVNSQNLVQIEPAREYTMIDRLKDVIERLDMANTKVIEEPLRELLRGVLDTYDGKKYYNKEYVEKHKVGETDPLSELKNYLIKTNKKLRKLLMDYFDTYGKLSANEYNKLSLFLVNIQKWEVDEQDLSEKYYDEGLYTSTQFVANCIQNMTRVYPSILMNDSGFYKKVHKHWGLSEKHRIDVVKFIDKYYEKIEKFKQDAVLTRVLKEVETKLLDIIVFIENIPIYTPIVKNMGSEDDKDTNKKNIQEFYSIFDKETIYMLFTNCFLSVIYEYMVVSDDAELINSDQEIHKVEVRQSLKSRMNMSDLLTSADVETDDAESEERDRISQQYSGKHLELKERVSALLLTFLDIEKENKETVDFSYAQIIKRVNRSKEKEKKEIIEFLGNMSIDERKVEDMFKNYRIGRWNVGQQKGLIQYDKNTYDRERDELLRKLHDGDSTDMDEVDLMLRDVYEMDADDEKAVEQEDEMNMLDDMNQLNPEFMDGVYYQEDAEDEGDYY